MLNYMLLFAGVCTFFNGLALLKVLNQKDLGYFNLLVGLLQALTLILMFINGDLSGKLMALKMTSVTLFMFTYLYIALTGIKGLDSKGLSLYCGWVALIAIAYFVLSVQQRGVINAVNRPEQRFFV